MKLHKLTLLFYLVALASFASLPTANGQFSQVKDWLSGIFREIFHSSETVKNRVQMSMCNMDRTLDNLITDVGNFTRDLNDVEWCFEPMLKGRVMNIFNGSASFKSICVNYYKSFPKKEISNQSISNLLNSTREMISRCMDIYRRSSVRYGFTALSDRSLEDVQMMLGYHEPNNQQVNRRGKRLSGNDPECQPDRATPPPDTYDWRDFGLVTPVRTQWTGCGDDWAFATAGAIESALLVRHKTLRTNATLNLSEQQLIDCVKENGCQGGDARAAFNYIKNYGISEEKVVPYVGHVEACPYAKVDYYYPINDYCVRSRFRYDWQTPTETLSENTIQQILSEVGPLYVLTDMNPSRFRNYRSGVFDERDCTSQVNHAMLLVGYTRNAWILKNSWSPDWGEAGYVRLARNKNMCGISSEIAWPLL